MQYALVQTLLLTAPVIGMPSVRSGPRSAPVSRTWAQAYQLAEVALARLSLKEKVGMVTGTDFYRPPGCVGSTTAPQSIPFPALCLQDSPVGIRWTGGNSTAFTPAIMAGATWDIDLISERGRFLGDEFYAAGIHLPLGPVAGPLGKNAKGGRNWEGFGADPYLSGIAVAETVKEMQAAGVQAVSKHLVGNEQETNRVGISSNIDNRALHELYLWPFADSIHANTAALMCSYNQLNGTYACENDLLMNGIVKEELGFPGFIVTDWDAQKTTATSANNGLDMSMYNNQYWGPHLVDAVNHNEVPMARLDDMIKRVLAGWYLVGQDQSFPSVSFARDVKGNHKDNVRAIARDGIVLLKNDGNILPLSKPKSIALIGSATINNPNGINSCEDRGCNTGALGMGWGSGTADYPYFVSPYDAFKTRTDTDGTRLTLSNSDDLTQGANAARNKDLAVVVITSDSGEGYITVEGNEGDRNDLNPWHNGNALVKAVAAANRNTIVVVHSVGPVILESILQQSGVKAIVWAGLPSAENGNALIDIIYGAKSPSGKLPYTIAKSEADYSGQISYGDSDGFTDGVFVDYRWFDARNLAPRYEFGFGLSYTNFTYTAVDVSSTVQPGPATGSIIPGGRSDLWETVATVTCTITNTGRVAGAEAAQLYIGLPSSAPPSPPRQLRGFTKLALQPQQSGQAKFNLRRRDLSYWDVPSQEWVVPKGDFKLFIGASSRDIRLSATLSAGSASLSSQSIIQAEAYTSYNDVRTETCGDAGGGIDVGYINTGSWLGYSKVDFGTQGATKFTARVASATKAAFASIDLVLDNRTNPPIASIPVPMNTGGWQSYVTLNASLAAVTGVHNVYLNFQGPQGPSGVGLVNVNWFQFN